MDLARARDTANRRAALGGRRAKTAQGGLAGLTGRAVSELERLRPGARPRRGRRDSGVERIKHLV